MEDKTFKTGKNERLVTEEGRGKQWAERFPAYKIPVQKRSSSRLRLPPSKIEYEEPRRAASP